MGILLSEDSFKRTERAVRYVEHIIPRGPEERGRRDYRPRPPIVTILLEDLDSEGQADCAIIEKVDSHDIQKLELLGNVVTSFGGFAHFTLSFKGQKTAPLAYTISAADLQKALEGLSTIGKGNVRVSLGAHVVSTSPNVVEEIPGVWIVQFFFDGVILKSTDAIPLLVFGDLGGGAGPWIGITAASVWADTGTIETMNDIVPVGTPTPMRAGAVAVGLWFPGLGYGCIACEAREFTANPYYY